MRTYEDAITLLDFILLPFYVCFVFFIAIAIKRKYERIKPHYKYFVRGLAVKVLGAIAICLIYDFYYTAENDTLLYYHSSSAMKDLLFNNPSGFFKIYFTYHVTPDVVFNALTSSDETPAYIYDQYAFFVSKLFTIVNLLSFDSFIPMAILIAFISYSGIWRMYEVFIAEFGHLYKKLAIAFLFIPSVFFWGSGLLKDAITISAVGWFTYGFYFGAIKRKKIFSNLVVISISSFMLLSVKPYIFAALIPGSVLWFFNNSIAGIKSKVFKFIMLPAVITMTFVVSYFLLQNFETSLGSYSIDNVMTKAADSQEDLKREVYNGHSFDIGKFDGTLVGALTLAPLAIVATLFRPYIWEVKNIVMLISGLENAIILFATLYLLLRLRVLGFFQFIGKHPLLLFSVAFSIFFSFTVGLSISNFGSLVRLKIPCIPFFVASLQIMMDYYLKSIGRRTLDYI